MELRSTPSAGALHRVNRPLAWEHQPGRAAPDGQVEVRTIQGVQIPVVLQQPRKPKKYMGVSLFLPQCSQPIFEAAHEHLGAGPFKCCVSVPNTQLPQQLGLVNDHTFCLRLFGEQARTVVGQHYTLFATAEMPVSTFEEKLSQLQQTFLPCTMTFQGVKHLTTLIDPFVTPTDKRSAVAAQALESLAEQTSDPNTAIFATLFALDMRACDPDWEEVVAGCNNRALLVAAALDSYVVRDPELCDDAWDMQEELAAELPDYKPRRCEYKPFWVSAMHLRAQAQSQAVLCTAKSFAILRLRHSTASDPLCRKATCGANTCQLVHACMHLSSQGCPVPTHSCMPRSPLPCASDSCACVCTTGGEPAPVSPGAQRGLQWTRHGQHV